MRLSSAFESACLIASAALLVGGCVVRETRYREPAPVVVQQPVPGEVVVSEAPPPPREEVITVSPDPTFVWVGGAWVWHGHWVWDGGHWMRPPRAGAVWMPHRYVYRGGRRVWIEGGWR